MAVATTKAFDVVALDDIEAGPEHDGRVPLNIRRHFDIRAFGIRANRAVGEGHIIGEHDEVGLGATGQEELYLVLSGAATFTVGDEQIDAPAGTLVFVRDPAQRRSAIAKETGTTVLAIGGTPGKAYELPLGELMNPMWDAYRAEDYEGALAALQPAGRRAATGARLLQRRVHGGAPRAHGRRDRAPPAGGRGRRSDQGAHPDRRGSDVPARRPPLRGARRVIAARRAA